MSTLSQMGYLAQNRMFWQQGLTGSNALEFRKITCSQDRLSQARKHSGPIHGDVRVWLEREILDRFTPRTNGRVSYLIW